MAWLTGVLNFIDPVTAILTNSTQYFDLDTAVGVQLDFVGKLTGVTRILSFQPTEGSPVLSDKDFRFLIRAQIAKNHWNGTLEHLNVIWNTVGLDLGLNIIDNQDMTMTVVVNGTMSTIQKELITHGLVVPKPQGVGITYVTDSAASSFRCYAGIGSIQTIYYKTTMRDSESNLAIPGVYN
jgi:hypothetical protein